MATKKYLDDNGLLYFWSQLKTLFTGKVDKVAGKGLSTEDYSAAEKTKLSGIAASATANSPSSTTPQMDGEAATGSETDYSRGDHVHPTDTSRAPLASPTFTGTPSAPTASQGTDTTQLATTAFVQTAVAAAGGGLQFEIVASLPGSGSASKIYLMSNAGSAPNVYDEYIWVSSAWEKIGTTAVDLSGYMLTADLVAITNSEIDTVVAS